MELSNLEVLPGRTIVRHLGLVQGSTVRSKHAGKDLLAGLRNFVGGELKAYTELLNESRQLQNGLVCMACYCDVSEPVNLDMSDDLSSSLVRCAAVGTSE